MLNFATGYDPDGIMASVSHQSTFKVWPFRGGLCLISTMIAAKMSKLFLVHNIYCMYKQIVQFKHDNFYKLKLDLIDDTLYTSLGHSCTQLHHKLALSVVLNWQLVKQC